LGVHGWASNGLIYRQPAPVPNIGKRVGMVSGKHNVNYKKTTTFGAYMTGQYHFFNFLLKSTSFGT
jgi:hypothetical protein